MKTSQATASIFCLFTTKPEGVTLTGCIKSKIWKRFEVIAKFAPMKSASPISRFLIIPPYSFSAVRVLLSRFYLNFILILSTFYLENLDKLLDKSFFETAGIKSGLNWDM